MSVARIHQYNIKHVYCDRRINNFPSHRSLTLCFNLFDLCLLFLTNQRLSNSSFLCFCIFQVYVNVLILFLVILYHLQYGKGEQRFVKTGKRRLHLWRVCSDYIGNILKFIRHRPPTISTDRRHQPQSSTSSTNLHQPL